MEYLFTVVNYQFRVLFLDGHFSIVMICLIMTICLKINMVARDELFIEYEKLQNALVRKDVDSVIAMIGERNREIDMAFYQADGTTEKKIRSSLENAIGDADMELAELSLDYLDIAVEDNHKLVSLVRGGDISAIGFNFKSFSGSLSYDFVFRRQDGKWVLTR